MIRYDTILVHNIRAILPVWYYKYRTEYEYRTFGFERFDLYSKKGTLKIT